MLTWSLLSPCHQFGWYALVQALTGETWDVRDVLAALCASGHMPEAKRRCRAPCSAGHLPQAEPRKC